MRDMHCHILPGVDDGSRDMQMSLAMFDAALDAGVTSIVCTPHVRNPYFDYDRMMQAYRAFKDVVSPFPVTMGWEVAHAMLIHLGIHEWAPRLGFEDSDEFLLELDSGCTSADFEDYERTIYTLQGMGYEVIIAHPERYKAVQKDIDLARRLVRMGCRLQASADFIAGGRLGREKRPAKRLFAAGLYSDIASDAHRPEHYRYLVKAVDRYGSGCDWSQHGQDTAYI